MSKTFKTIPQLLEENKRLLQDKKRLIKALEHAVHLINSEWGYDYARAYRWIAFDSEWENDRKLDVATFEQIREAINQVDAAMEAAK